MKKILKKIGKFLIEMILMIGMLKGAQYCMNLPFGWASFGYLVIFSVSLIAWNFLHPIICYSEVRDLIDKEIDKVEKV